MTNEMNRDYVLKNDCLQNSSVKFSGRQVAPNDQNVESDLLDPIIMKSLIAKNIPGKGIFFGAWAPTDEKGISLEKEFNVFAAPQDLNNAYYSFLCGSYYDIVKELGRLSNRGGHDCKTYLSHIALYNDLKKERNLGDWFVPPGELMTTKNGLTGDAAAVPSLFDLRLTGDFYKTFTTETYISKYSEDEDPGRMCHCYWSCTTPPGKDYLSTEGSNSLVDFSSGGSLGWDSPTVFYPTRASCRLCRVELRPLP